MNETENTTEYGLNSNSLFTAGAVTIILALLVPASAILADIMLTFSVFVAVAIAAISFSNVKPADLKGFACMTMAASVVRVFTSIVLVRIVLTGSSAGHITQILSSPLLTSALLSAIAAGALILILTGLTMHRIRNISKLIAEYFTKILKVKQMFVETALRTNVIDQDAADKLEEEASATGSFFARINACSRFTFCEIILTILAFVSGTAGVIIVSATGNFPADSVLIMVCQLAIATSLLSALSLLSTASMSRISVEYFESAKTIHQTHKPEPSQRRKVSSSIAQHNTDSQPIAEVIRIDIDDDAITPGTNNYADAQDTNWHTEDDMSKFLTWNKRDLESTESISTLTQIIQGPSFDKEQTILIASDNIASLPVTVPVNIAVELSNAGLKCLLVDLDLKREAVSNVFDVTGQSCGSERFITDSGVNGISIICAGMISKLTSDKVISLIGSCTEKYDRILVYAPDIMLNSKVDLISTSCKSAMLFGPQNNYNDNMTQLREALVERNCDFIEPDEVLVEV
ncbi:MAG: hypothetical protein KAS23_02225 [Anaerohalosphaera sp.]|nr:hypothetical protein [Anaerohalosphaera sp.]